MVNSPQHARPVLEPPLRWTVCALAWLAFSVAGFLSWHALEQGPVAGCGGGGLFDCSEVLNSGWSRWLGVPIAFVGLVCYALIATLCLLLEVGGAQTRRWLGTMLVLLATMAVGASLWYVLLQVFAIQRFCPYCLVVDVCGIAIGVLVLWSTINRWQSKRTGKSNASGMKALQSTFGAPPATARSTPTITVATASDESTPLLGIAMGSACALLAVLIGGQIIFPSETFVVDKIALADSINLTGSSDDGANDPTETSSGAQTHVAMRIPSGPGSTADSPATNPVDKIGINGGDASVSPSAVTTPSATEPSTDSNQAAVPTGRPQKERLVSFLGGKLTLDVYKHPLLGSPTAPYVIAEMISYDCSHCRKMSKIIEEGRERYGDQLAVIIMVMPMEHECNPLVTANNSKPGACTTARMALGVASLKPTAFPDFHEWLMKDEKGPPELAKIVTKAYGLTDRGRMGTFTKGDSITKQIRQYVELYDTLSKQQKTGSKPFGLPAQIMGDKVMSGSAEKEDVFRAWEENTGMKPKQ